MELYERGMEVEGLEVLWTLYYAVLNQDALIMKFVENTIIVFSSVCEAMQWLWKAVSFWWLGSVYFEYGKKCVLPWNFKKIYVLFSVWKVSLNVIGHAFYVVLFIVMTVFIICISFHSSFHLSTCCIIWCLQLLWNLWQHFSKLMWPCLISFGMFGIT